MHGIPKFAWWLLVAFGLGSPLTLGSAYTICPQDAFRTPAPEPVTALQQSMEWLEGKAKELIAASRREMKGGIAAFPPQAGKGYEAFWLRDYVYMLEGCPQAFSNQELRDACLLFVSATRADGAGVDCIRFDGTPIYQPGYGTMGKNPVVDGSPFTVAVAWHTHRRLQDRLFLNQIIDRLVNSLRAVPRHPATGLVRIAPEGHDRCPYGFMDTVRQQGDILFGSLLLVQAERQLADLLDATSQPQEARQCREDAERVAAAVRETFWDEDLGLFRAATLKCREPDLWGSAFAVYLEVATPTQALRIARYFERHHAQITQRGQLRHLPAGVYWESACAKDTYQNGGFWATPVGWYICTLDRVNPALAEQTLIDLVQDFQKRGVNEWVNGEQRAVPNYVASVTMPLAGAHAMLQRRQAKR